jgi:hypothetical protein
MGPDFMRRVNASVAPADADRSRAGVEPERLRFPWWHGPRTEAAGFTGTTWPVTRAGIAVADFNLDGKLDLAATNGDYLRIFFSAGTTLSSEANYRNSPCWTIAPPPIASAHFAGGRWPDLAVGTNTGVQIVKNLGQGVFYAPPAIVVPPGSESHTAAVIAPFDSTGHEDIAVDVSGPEGGGDVVVLYGDGTGRFPASFDPNVGFGLSGFAVGDFNGDGKLDLAYYEIDSSGNGQQLATLLNSGHRSFTAGSFIDYVNGQSPIAGDFNNDGYSDFAIADGSNIDVYLNNGNGTYSGPQSYAAGSSPTFLLQADINKDGNRDILAADSEGKQIVVLLGNGNGTFQPARFVPLSAAPSKLIVGDFNGDGKVDLAVACGKAIEILLGDGKGNFSWFATYNQKLTVTSLAQAQLRRNGIEDILFTSGSLGILYGKGNGSFGSPTTYTVGAYPIDVVASDFNEDGSPDVVVVDGASDAITLMLNQGGTRIALKSSAGSVYVHKPVTFTATVTESVSGSGVPTGTVVFMDGSKAIGTVTLSSGAAKLTTSSLTVGTHTITASYSGSASFNPKASTGLTEKVLP